MSSRHGPESDGDTEIEENSDSDDDAIQVARAQDLSISVWRGYPLTTNLMRLRGHFAFGVLLKVLRCTMRVGVHRVIVPFVIPLAVVALVNVPMRTQSGAIKFRHGNGFLTIIELCKTGTSVDQHL